PVDVHVVNRGDEAFKIDGDGDIVQEYGPGDVLFDGVAQTCATATVSYWGYRIRMFPYATLKWGFAMLRCFNGSPQDILMHLPSFWRGRFPKADCVDFLYNDIEIQTQGRSLAYQKIGEGEGHAQSVRWRVADRPVRLAVPLH
ncbi:MAG: hypothetical protein ABEN55_15390, partial [Bradymonadaceae bacterium]